MTPKQETFCQAYVECGNASEAYRRAYDAARMKPTTVNRKAKVELDKGKVRARISIIRAAVQRRHDTTTASLVAALETDRTLARNNDQASAAIAATMAIARLYGIADLPRPIDFALPEIRDAETALAASAAIIQAVSQGRLTRDEGKDLAAMVRGHCDVMSKTTLEELLQQMEAIAEQA
jgi:phage terminase small subunit